MQILTIVGILVTLVAVFYGFYTTLSVGALSLGLSEGRGYAKMLGFDRWVLNFQTLPAYPLSLMTGKKYNG